MLLHKVAMEGVAHRRMAEVAVGILWGRGVYWRWGSLDGVTPSAIRFHEITVELLSGHGGVVGTVAAERLRGGARDAR